MIFNKLKILFNIYVIFIFSGSYAIAQYDTKALMSSGIKLVQNKEYTKAIIKFNKVIYVKPYLFEPYFFRGYTKYVLGDYFGAESDFNKSLTINPYYAEAYRFRAIIRGILKDYNRAFLDFEEGVKLDTFNFYIYLNRSSLYTEIEEYQMALDDCNTVISLNPTLPDAFLNRGTTYFLLEKYDNALQDYNKAIELKPNSELAYIKRGFVFYEQEKYKKAIGDFDKAAQINPVLSIIYFYRALAKSSDLNYTGALDDYNKVLELDPINALTYYNLAILKTHVGALDEAIKDYSKVLELKPNHILSMYNRAGLYHDQEKYMMAINDYNIAINLFPEFPGAYINRSASKQKIGDKEGAMEDYNTGISILEKYKNEENKNFFDRYADTSKYFKTMIELDTEFEYYNKESKPKLADMFFDISILPIFKLVLLENKVDNKPFVNNYTYLINELTNTRYCDTVFSLSNEFSFNYFRKNEQKEVQFKNECIDNLYTGIANQDKQNYNSAMAFFNNSISKDTLLAAAWFSRASLELEIDEFMQQFKIENSIITIGSSSNSSTNNDNEGMADLDLAEHDLKMTISLSPDFALAYYNLANLNCIKSDFNEAIINYTKAIQKLDDFPEAHFNRGLVRIYLQNTSQGCKDLSKAGELGIDEAYKVLKKFCR